MTMKPLPDCDTLQRLLRYEPERGLFFWKPRSVNATGNLTALKVWNTRFAGKPALIAVHPHGYRHGTLNGIFYLAHRVAWKMYYGLDPNDIDHINGVYADNRIVNLRSVDHAQNMKNMRRFVTNTSGVTGIYLDSARDKWVAEIIVDGQKKYLGRYAKFSDAVFARKQAETKGNFHDNHGRH